MTKDEIAANAIRKAADHVNELRAEVDPGHIPMLTYLKRLERRLREQAVEFESRCRYESGE